MSGVNTPPLDEREADGELTAGDEYTPYFMDHEPWHPYEEHEQLASGDN
jgi:hypothetical protein